MIRLELNDCFTGQVTKETDLFTSLDLERVNSATGPIAVRGAEPGDSLVVELLEINPGPRGAAMIIPGFGQLIALVQGPVTRIFRVEDGTIHMNDRVRFPIRPMVGVIGCATDGEECINFLAGQHGGNLDNHLHGPGSTVYLPVRQPGGMLAIGDMHACMGDGEVSGTGVEIDGEVVIRVGLHKGAQGIWPVTELGRLLGHARHHAAATSAAPSSWPARRPRACSSTTGSFTIEDAFIFLSRRLRRRHRPGLPAVAASAIARVKVPKIVRLPAALPARMTPPVPTPGATVAALPRSGIRQIMELAMERGGTLNLSFGEPDFDTPAHIVEAAAEAARSGRTRYTASRGIPELREAAAAAITRRAGHVVTPDQVVATVGGVQGVFAALAALCDRRDAVLVPDPCWPNYVGICTLLGLEVVRYPLPASTGFEPDLDVLERLAGMAGAKVLVTNTPSNPTGAVWRRETVAATVDIAVRHGLFVLSDEVYDEMAFDGEHVPSAPFAPDHVVTVYSLSKTYAMTGWRIGYATAPPALIGSLGKVPEVEVSCPTAPAQWAAVAALTGPQDCVKRDARRLPRPPRPGGGGAARGGPVRGRTAGRVLRRSPTSPPPPPTRFAFAEHLVREHGVAVAPGDTFGPGGAGLLRISLAAAPETIAEGIRRIGAAVRAGVPA